MKTIGSKIKYIKIIQNWGRAVQELILQLLQQQKHNGSKMTYMMMKKTTTVH